MSGSVAEERIRAKAEAMLRHLFPAGRIIHELGVGSYGPSVIDIACVTPNLIAGVEVKSERDVLTRLPHQYQHARCVVDLYALCAPPVVVAKVVSLQRSNLAEMEPFYVKGRLVGQRLRDNPAHVPDLVGLDILTETEDGIETKYSWASENGYSARQRVQPAILNPAQRLGMLWAAELRAIGLPFGATYRSNRSACINLISEGMTGREVRRAVCAALRNRTFARADQAMEAA